MNPLDSKLFAVLSKALYTGMPVGEVPQSELHDGEVLGIDHDGRLIQWDKPGQTAYNCGETLEGYGVENLTERERTRLGL